MTTDNAVNNKKMIRILAEKMQHQNRYFTPRRQVLCFAHILNLVVQAAMKTFDVEPEIVVAVAASEQASEDTPLILNVDMSSEPDRRNEDVHSDDDQPGADGDASVDCEDTQPPDSYDPVLRYSPPPLSSLTLGATVEKLRTIIRATRTGSRRVRKYKAWCVKQKMENTARLPLDCQTRWSSTYTMLDAAIEKRTVLDNGCDDFKKAGKATKLSDEEWKLLEIFLEIIEPFAMATANVESSRHQTISDVLTMVEVHK